MLADGRLAWFLLQDHGRNYEAMPQGRYRIGARDLPAAYDNELPPQAVELSGFRIGVNPISNGEYLAFKQAGGYSDQALWDADGWDWRQVQNITQPDHWRHDARGRWYGVGINGPHRPAPVEPVLGISRHEAAPCPTRVSRLSLPANSVRHGWYSYP